MKHKLRCLAKCIPIALLIGFVLGLLVYNHFDTDEVITLYDSTIVEIPTEVPIPYEVVKYIDESTHDTVFKTILDTFYIDLTQPIDSAEILSDWLKTRIYKDTLRDDDLVAYLNETVQFNRITDREFSYQILRPMYQKTNSLYVGAFVYNTGLTPYAQYNFSNHSVSLGADPFNKRVFLGYGYKIK